MGRRGESHSHPRYSTYKYQWVVNRYADRSVTHFSILLWFPLSSWAWCIFAELEQNRLHTRIQPLHFDSLVYNWLENKCSVIIIKKKLSYFPKIKTPLIYNCPNTINTKYEDTFYPPGRCWPSVPCLCIMFLLVFALVLLLVVVMSLLDTIILFAHLAAFYLVLQPRLCLFLGDTRACVVCYCSNHYHDIERCM